MTAFISKRVAYLGPRGTFTEEALLSQPDLASGELVEMGSIDAVLDAVDNGQVDLGFVPIENSIEGTVPATIDSLVFDHDLYIEREVVLDIHLHLLGLPGAEIGRVREVHSYPHAIGQCRRFLNTELPGAIVHATSSTAEAARLVAEAADPALAAIAPQASRDIYGLATLRADIEDHGGNQTRFLLVGKGMVPAPTGNDKTSVVCFQVKDQPGSLFSILAEFYARNINLTKLESRPSKRELGQYCFVIEFNGHVSDHDVADALVGLKGKLADLKFLGSFPNVREAQPPKGREVPAEDSAWGWLASIRKQIAEPRG
ncbi:MAG: prephenate dehydratase [Actinomycetota bacterium]|nr:prephenate dehydratase [Actinomycetota bacterium]